MTGVIYVVAPFPPPLSLVGKAGTAEQVWALLMHAVKLNLIMFTCRGFLGPSGQ